MPPLHFHGENRPKPLVGACRCCMVLDFKTKLGFHFSNSFLGFCGIFGLVLGLIFWIFKTSNFNLFLNKIGA